MKKPTTVVLYCASNGSLHKLEFAHAERLLRMQNNGGWTLPEDSPFEFENNELNYRADTRGRKKSSQK